MNGIVFHYEEYEVQLDMLNAEQLGMLMKSLISVAKGEDPSPEMDALTQMCFAFMKDRMIRDQELSEKRARARRKDDPETNEEQTGSKNNKTEQSGTPIPITNTNTNNQLPITNSKEKDICASDSDPDPAEELFRKVWEMYPNKKGLKAVSKDQKQRLLDEVGEDHLIRALNRYKDEHREKELRGDFCPPWQNGSTWFNSGFADYLDGNYQQAPPDPKQNKSSQFVNFEQSSGEELEDTVRMIMESQGRKT